MNSLFQNLGEPLVRLPISEYIPGHNLSHHRFLQAREDVMRTSKVRLRWNFLNLVSFPFAVPPGILLGNARYGKLRGARRGGDSCGSRPSSCGE